MLITDLVFILNPHVARKIENEGLSQATQRIVASYRLIRN